MTALAEAGVLEVRATSGDSCRSVLMRSDPLWFEEMMGTALWWRSWRKMADGSGGGRLRAVVLAATIGG